nr:immunoglobulin heavy chain junction region [Mus musculus]MBK4184882.1 immunoglobulin heavy chain junction region [Mus musculus]
CARSGDGLLQAGAMDYW